MVIWVMILAVAGLLVLAVALVWTVQGLWALWRQRQPAAVERGPADGSGFKVQVYGGASYISEAGVLLNTLGDILPNAECRAGECGGCRMRLLSGKVHWVAEPQIPVNRDKEFLPCSCIAASDLLCAK
jgi:hypothetical protein